MANFLSLRAEKPWGCYCCCLGVAAVVDVVVVLGLLLLSLPSRGCCCCWCCCRLGVAIAVVAAVVSGLLLLLMLLSSWVCYCCCCRCRIAVAARVFVAIVGFFPLLDLWGLQFCHPLRHVDGLNKTNRLITSLSKEIDSWNEEYLPAIYGNSRKNNDNKQQRSKRAQERS